MGPTIAHLGGPSGLIKIPTTLDSLGEASYSRVRKEYHMEITNPEAPQTSRSCEICHAQFEIGYCPGRPPKYCPACRGGEVRKKDRERGILQRKSRKEEAFTRAFAYLKRTPCRDCGETDPLVLEFDHVRDEKLGNLWTPLGTWVWLEEVERCEVRCVKCLTRKLREGNPEMMMGLKRALEAD